VRIPSRQIQEGGRLPDNGQRPKKEGCGTGKKKTEENHQKENAADNPKPFGFQGVGKGPPEL